MILKKHIFIFSQKLKDFNESFRKNVTYDKIKIHIKT